MGRGAAAAAKGKAAGGFAMRATGTKDVGPNEGLAAIVRAVAASRGGGDAGNSASLGAWASGRAVAVAEPVPIGG